MNQHAYSVTDDGWVSFRIVRPVPGRKYYNHMAKHSPGAWHRHWLLTSGQYIKTSDPDMRKGYGWNAVGEDGPELAALTIVHPNDLYMPTAEELGINRQEASWTACCTAYTIANYTGFQGHHESS